MFGVSGVGPEREIVSIIEAVGKESVGPGSIAPLPRYEQPTYRALKRTFDVTLSLLGLIILSPLFLVTGLAVVLSGGFPVLFRQIRLGEGGRLFTIFKFRTMRKNAEEWIKGDAKLLEEFEKSYKLEEDPRITRIGSLLRATTLDELPQLWNVLKGDMSLVGPRPIVPPEIAKYGDHKELYLSMKPGCAGLWQCSGRSNLRYEERVALDREYFQHASLRYDVQILWRTLVSVLLRRGAG